MKVNKLSKKAQVSNKELYGIFRTIVVSTLQILQHAISSGSTMPLRRVPFVKFIKSGYQVDYSMVPSFSTLLYNHLETIRELPEFNECTESLLKTEIFRKELSLKTHPDNYGSALLNHLILPFLIEYLESTKNFAFDENVFNEEFTELKNYLYSETLEYRVITPLLKFSADVEAIDLDEIKIKKFSYNERVDLYREHGTVPFSFGEEILMLWMPWGFVLESKYSLPKGETIPTYSVEQNFEDVVLALRLFKYGSVGINFLTFTPLGWKGIGSQSGSQLFKTPFGGRYSLVDEEVQGFRDFWHKTRDVIKKRLEILQLPFKRFSDAYYRLQIEDRLIDYMIAFEALFIEGKVDLTYKISRRTARLLGKTFEERKGISLEIRNSYDIRGELVHGEKKEVPPQVKFGKRKLSRENFIQEVENYLRRCLRAYLDLSKQYERKQEILDRLDYGTTEIKSLW